MGDVMRATKIVLALAAVCLLALPAFGQRRGSPQPQNISPTYWSPYPPPKPLRLIQGHWTPYFPPDPASFPEDATVHIIVPGDTLWDLSGQYYGDNLLWPFLWEHNTYITDPHWIYPGDPLLIPPLILIEPGELEAVDAFEAPPVTEVFMPAGSLSDMYCSFYVAPFYEVEGEGDQQSEWVEYDTFIIGGDDPLRVGYSDYQVLYINKGAADGIVPGQEFSVLAWQQRLRHPITQDWLGEVIRRVGTVRVLCTQENTSTVIVTSACDAIEPGMRLKPWEEHPSPMRPIDLDIQRHCVEENPYGRGHIVYLDYDQVDAGTWDRVAIDLGAADGVLPGDRFLVFRETQDDRLRIEYDTWGKVGLERYHEKIEKMSWIQAEQIMENAYPGHRRGPFKTRKILSQIRDLSIPRRVVGELIVLATREETSTAILSYANRAIVPGDQIELRTGQPVN